MLRYDNISYTMTYHTNTYYNITQHDIILYSGSQLLGIAFVASLYIYIYIAFVIYIYIYICILLRYTYVYIYIYILPSFNMLYSLRVAPSEKEEGK